MFLVGVVLLPLALLLWIVELFGGGSGVVPWAFPVALGIGAIALLVGLAGLIVGGRHSAE